MHLPFILSAKPPRPLLSASHLPTVHGRTGPHAGGPYEHRWVGGVCRVCGHPADKWETGCPARVIVDLYHDEKKLSTPQQAEAAAKRIQEIWAAEKAKTEEAV